MTETAGYPPVSDAEDAANSSDEQLPFFVALIFCAEVPLHSQHR